MIDQINKQQGNNGFEKHNLNIITKRFDDLCITFLTFFLNQYRIYICFQMPKGHL